MSGLVVQMVQVLGFLVVLGMVHTDPAVDPAAGASSRNKRHACTNYFKTSFGECFYAAKDDRTSWSGAPGFCESKGMFLAEPENRAAREVSRILRNKFGAGTDVWVGARNSRTYPVEHRQFFWERSGNEISSSYWIRKFDHPYKKYKCVMLNAATDDEWAGPYQTVRCRRSSSVLCEVPRPEYDGCC